MSPEKTHKKKELPQICVQNLMRTLIPHYLFKNTFLKTLFIKGCFENNVYTQLPKGSVGCLVKELVIKGWFLNFMRVVA